MIVWADVVSMPNAIRNIMTEEMKTDPLIAKSLPAGNLTTVESQSIIASGSK
jgi:hypothetical protein